MVELLEDISEVIGFTSDRPNLRNSYLYTFEKDDLSPSDGCYVVRDDNFKIVAALLYNTKIKEISMVISNVQGYGITLIKYILNKYKTVALFCKNTLMWYYEDLGFNLIEDGAYCEMKYKKEIHEED